MGSHALQDRLPAGHGAPTPCRTGCQLSMVLQAAQAEPVAAAERGGPGQGARCRRAPQPQPGGPAAWSAGARVRCPRARQLGLPCCSCGLTAPGMCCAALAHAAPAARSQPLMLAQAGHTSWCGRRFVKEVSEEHVWVDLARGLQARLHALDACADLAALQAFPGDLAPGQPLGATVLQVRLPACPGRDALGAGVSAALPACICSMLGRARGIVQAWSRPGSQVSPHKRPRCAGRQGQARGGPVHSKQGPERWQHPARQGGRQLRRAPAVSVPAGWLPAAHLGFVPMHSAAADWGPALPLLPLSSLQRADSRQSCSALNKGISCAGAGLKLQLSAHAMAQVALTDIRPGWVDNALRGLRKGSLLSCKLISQVASSKPGARCDLAQPQTAGAGAGADCAPAVRCLCERSEHVRVRCKGSGWHLLMLAALRSAAS